jgi:SPP1 family predicted phage head-tail adaptor
MRKTLGAKLIHRITIEENRGLTNDGAGNQVPLWETVASSVPAFVKPISGAELTRYDKKMQNLTHNVKIRYRPNMRKDKHRIIFNGRVLGIQYIINTDEQNIELNMQCSEA